MATVTIEPKTADGYLKLSITTTGKMTAKLVIETWRTGTPPAPDKRIKRQPHAIIEAKASANKKVMTGKVDLLWPLKDPDLTVRLDDASRSVRVQVVGHGSLDETHPLTAAEYTAITDFVATAFP